jgi:hypothetical protein
MPLIVDTNHKCITVNGQYPGKHPAVKLPLKDDGKDSDKNAGHPGKHPDEHPAQDPEPALMSEWIKINEQDPPDIVAIGLSILYKFAYFIRLFY